MLLNIVVRLITIKLLLFMGQGRVPFESILLGSLIFPDSVIMMLLERCMPLTFVLGIPTLLLIIRFSFMRVLTFIKLFLMMLLTVIFGLVFMIQVHEIIVKRVRVIIEILLVSEAMMFMLVLG